MTVSDWINLLGVLVALLILSTAILTLSFRQMKEMKYLNNRAHQRGFLKGYERGYTNATEEAEYDWKRRWMKAECSNCKDNK